MIIYGVGVMAFLTSIFLGNKLRPGLEAEHQKEMEKKMVEEKLITREQLEKNKKENKEQVVRFIAEKSGYPPQCRLGNISLFLCFIAVVIITPIVEECLCRYLIFEIFGKSNILAYIFSGLTFIFLH